MVKLKRQTSKDKFTSNSQKYLTKKQINPNKSWTKGSNNSKNWMIEFDIPLT